MHWLTGSQWSCARTGEIWSRGFVSETNSGILYSLQWFRVDWGSPASTALQKSRRLGISAVTSCFVTSSPTDRWIWRNRLNWKKQLLTTRLMWCFMVNSASTRTPRSSTTVTGLTISSPTVRDRSVYASLRKLDRLPNHTSSVLCGLSCRRRDEHQSRTLSMHWLRCRRIRPMSEILPDRYSVSFHILSLRILHCLYCFMLFALTVVFDVWLLL